MNQTGTGVRFRPCHHVCSVDLRVYEIRFGSSPGRTPSPPSPPPACERIDERQGPRPRPLHRRHRRVRLLHRLGARHPVHRRRPPRARLVPRSTIRGLTPRGARGAARRVRVRLPRVRDGRAPQKPRTKVQIRVGRRRRVDRCRGRGRRARPSVPT